MVVYLEVQVSTMMTSSNGNIFRVTGPLCGEFTGPGEFPTQRPVTRSFDVFFDLRLNKRLSKQSWGWWFEKPSWSLWRQCNDYNHLHHGCLELFGEQWCTDWSFAFNICELYYTGVAFRSPRPSWLVVDFLSLGVNLHYPKYADLVIVHDPVGVVSTSLWNNFAICPWNKKICDTCSSTDVAPFPICRAIWINARRPPSENSHARLSSNNTQSWGGKLWNLWVFF